MIKKKYLLNKQQKICFRLNGGRCVSVGCTCVTFITQMKYLSVIYAPIAKEYRDMKRARATFETGDDCATYVLCFYFKWLPFLDFGASTKKPN